MLAALGLSGAELSVLLCDDATIRGLNRRYRRRDAPTDVLAFGFEADEPRGRGAERLLGDVVISLDTAARQARRGRRPMLVEVTTLLAHGLLHLLGFDHRDRAGARRMAARTDVLVSAAGSRRPVEKSGR
jgi:probable rRNA maturation factor